MKRKMRTPNLFSMTIPRDRAPANGAAGKMRTVDLFAGAGGLSLGFQRAGFDVVAAYDKWGPALTCYEENFDHPVFSVDLSDIEASVEHISQYAPEVVIGGPPCQDFSSAGKRTEGNRASLTENFAIIATRCKPRAIVMENVARARISAAYARAKNTLADCGYHVTEAVLDASLCGCPQLRKRFFSVATMVPPNGLLEDLLYGGSSEQLTVGEYMGDELDTEHYYRHPRNYSRRGIYSIHEPSATIRGVNRPIPPNYPGHPLDSAPISEARPLTTYERSRIQTFPKNWAWPRAKTTAEQLIGNAVPVELGSFVATCIREAAL